MAARALLINPPTGRFNREDRCQVSVEYQMVPALRPPMDLAYMAAILESAGYEGIIEDLPAQKNGWQRLDTLLKAHSPDVLIISSTNPTFHDDLQAARRARELTPQALVILKAPHHGFGLEELLLRYPELDVCLGNDYEHALMVYSESGSWEHAPGIAYRVAGSVVRNPDSPTLISIDSYPIPARHLLQNELYRRPDTGAIQTTVVTGRGCPHRCPFCSSTVFTKGSYTLREPERLQAELASCVYEYGIRDFFFKADTFTLDRQWVIQVCTMIRKELPGIRWVCNSRVDTVDSELLTFMRQAGCWGIAFGVESGNPLTLRRLGKHYGPGEIRTAIELCRAAGITSLCYFIIGLPWEDRLSIMHTIKFATNLKADLTEFHVALPFPGTPLHHQAVAQGLLKADDSAVGFDFSIPVMGTKYLTREEVYALKKLAVRAIYTNPTQILRLIRHFGNPRTLVRLSWFAAVKLFNIARRPISTSGNAP